MEIILREVGAGGGYEGSRPAERDGPLGPGVTLRDRTQPFIHLGPLFSTHSLHSMRNYKPGELITGGNCACYEVKVRRKYEGRGCLLVEFSRMGQLCASRPANLIHPSLVITRYHTQGDQDSPSLCYTRKPLSNSPACNRKPSQAISSHPQLRLL